MAAQSKQTHRYASCHVRPLKWPGEASERREALLGKVAAGLGQAPESGVIEVILGRRQRDRLGFLGRD